MCSPSLGDELINFWAKLNKKWPTGGHLIFFFFFLNYFVRLSKMVQNLVDTGFWGLRVQWKYLFSCMSENEVVAAILDFLIFRNFVKYDQNGPKHCVGRFLGYASPWKYLFSCRSENEVMAAILDFSIF